MPSHPLDRSPRTASRTLFQSAEDLQNTRRRPKYCGSAQLHWTELLSSPISRSLAGSFGAGFDLLGDPICNAVSTQAYRHGKIDGYRYSFFLLEYSCDLRNRFHMHHLIGSACLATHTFNLADLPYAVDVADEIH